MDEQDPTALLDSNRLRAAIGKDDNASMDTGERDVALEVLRQNRAIDTQEYVEASRQKQVRFKHPRFEHLPDRGGLYELLGALDEGGMGEVRIARDPYLDRKVAVKLLRLEKIERPLNVERFIREAQITAKLDHPNIIPIYSLMSENDGRASFAMKLVHGVTLKDIANICRHAYDTGSTPPPQVAMRRRLEIFLRICDAMGYAHDMGVIHRDIKPANIMVGEYNEVYVMDWGLAKTIDEPEAEATQTAMWAAQERGVDVSGDDEIHTQHGALLGTPVYMSPEQAAARHDLVSYPSDVYALGAILFELVCLERLIPGKGIGQILPNVAQGNHNAVAAYKDKYKIAPELAAIIRKASNVVLTERYQTVSELAADLRRFLDDEEVTAHPDSPVRATQRWMAHHRGLTFAIILALVTLSGGVMIYNLVQQNVAQQRQQVRERALSSLQSQVTERAHTLDRQFLRFELLVNRLAVAAQALIRDGSPREGTIYTSQDFDTGNGPDGLAFSKLYGKEISVTTPVFKPAPSVELEALDEQLRTMLPLATQFRSIFLDSRLASTPVESDEDLWKAIAVEGVPGRWAFVGLDLGVHISYPGKGGYSTDYDPRERPWYKAGKGKTRPEWGTPYVDKQGQGIVLPCVVGVRVDGEDRGVAGFEVALSFVQKQFMESTEPATQTFVVDGEGRVLVASRGSAMEIDVEDVEDLPKVQNPIILEALKSSTASVRVDRSVSPPNVFVVAPMPTLGWYYVAEAPLDRVLAAE